MSSGSPVRPPDGDSGGEPRENLTGSNSQNSSFSATAFNENEQNQQKNSENLEKTQKKSKNTPENPKTNSAIPSQSSNNLNDQVTWSEHIAKSSNTRRTGNAKEREAQAFVSNNVPNDLLDSYNKEKSLVSVAGTLFTPIADNYSHQKLLTRDFVLSAVYEDKQSYMETLVESGFSINRDHEDEFSLNEKSYIALKDYILSTSAEKQNVFMGSNMSSKTFSESFVASLITIGDDWLLASSFIKDDVQFHFEKPQVHKADSLLLLSVRFNKFSFTSTNAVLKLLKNMYDLETLTEMYPVQQEKFHGFQVLAKLNGTKAPPGVVIPNLVYTSILNTIKKCSKCNSTSHFSNECTIYCVNCQRFGHLHNAEDCPTNKTNNAINMAYKNAHNFSTHSYPSSKRASENQHRKRPRSTEIPNVATASLGEERNSSHTNNEQAQINDHQDVSTRNSNQTDNDWQQTTHSFISPPTTSSSGNTNTCNNPYSGLRELDDEVMTDEHIDGAANETDNDDVNMVETSKPQPKNPTRIVKAKKSNSDSGKRHLKAKPPGLNDKLLSTSPKSPESSTQTPLATPQPSFTNPATVASFEQQNSPSDASNSSSQNHIHSQAELGDTQQIYPPEPSGYKSNVSIEQILNALETSHHNSRDDSPQTERHISQK